MGNDISYLDKELRIVREGNNPEHYQQRLEGAIDNGPHAVMGHYVAEMEYYRKMAYEEMTRRLSRLKLELDAQLKKAKDNHATREKELLDDLKQAREQAKETETELQLQRQKEKELLDQLEQAREQAKSTETQVQEQLRKEKDHLEQAREQVKAIEAKLQEQLRKEQEEKKQNIEGRLTVAIEEEKVRVHQEFYNGFVEHFTKEKALLMEGMRKDIEEMGENMKKEVKMKLDKLKLEEEGGPMIGQDSECAVARN